MAYRNYSTAVGHIVDPNGFGDFKTISSALTAAISGQTIFIRPGTYTENPTLVAGVNLTAFNCDAFTPNVTISGTCTLSTAGTVSISGICLQTNSSALLAVTGSAASIVNLNNCYLNASNNNGITFSSTSSSAVINLDNCFGDLGSNTTFFAHSSAGRMNWNYSYITNSGASTTASTCSAGFLLFRLSEILFPITTSSTSLIAANLTSFNCQDVNTTPVTSGGANTIAILSEFSGGSASALSINNALSFIASSTINSNNTNAITGVGTLNYSGLIFDGGSNKINTTTQIGGTIQGGVFQAPSPGFLGEKITSGLVTGVSLSNNSALTITSISLTPGIWDVSAIGYCGFTGTATAMEISISTTNNAITGGNGDTQSQIVGPYLTSTNQTLVVPTVRATLKSTTTYYLTSLVLFSTGAATMAGRISATRVG